ncbi:hypothetical protein ACIBSW_19050 [Actinoplanes sp. NPDC049668]|uniref:hypothetical protein n=1 Tax=unclassified Actinoplanes TaxID=2626549 RepID=UPI00339E995F
MVLISLLTASAVMAAAARIERRLGPSAAGWLAALPVAFAVSLVAIAADATPDVAGSLALSAATHVPAQVAFGVTFAHVLRRRGLALGLGCGILAYLVGALLVRGVPAALAVVVAAVALAVGPRLMPAGQPRLPAPRHWSGTALTCLSAAAVVGAVLLASRFAGAGVAGAVAAFPTMCATLTVVAVARDGAAAGVHALGGLVRSLPCYLAFCLVVALSAPGAGVVAVGLGLLACLGTATLTWRHVPKALRPHALSASDMG